MYGQSLPLPVLIADKLNTLSCRVSSIGIQVAMFSAKGDLQTMKKFGTRVGGSLLALAFVWGIAAAVGVTAQAQYRNDNGQYQRRERDNNQGQNRDWRQRRDRDNRDNSR